MNEFIVDEDFHPDVRGYPELIRCIDCKLRFTNKCVLHDQAFPINKGNNWFCADGERRINNDSNRYPNAKEL